MKAVSGLRRMEKTVIYTDGGCSCNPGPGGWAYVIIESGEKFSASGREEFTTNNKMELTAVINALKKADDSGYGPVSLYTDSQYVKNGITLWIKKWLKNGWRTADKKEVKNRELWQELYDLNRRIKPEWNWIKGHAGDHYNELCDSLVRKEIKR